MLICQEHFGIPHFSSLHAWLGLLLTLLMVGEVSSLCPFRFLILMESLEEDLKLKATRLDGAHSYRYISVYENPFRLSLRPFPVYFRALIFPCQVSGRSHVEDGRERSIP